MWTVFLRSEFLYRSASNSFRSRPNVMNTKMITMTSRQSLALSAVVADVNDTERLKTFAKTVVNDAGKFGTILTVDRFEGRLTWHVSVTSQHSRSCNRF